MTSRGHNISDNHFTAYFQDKNDYKLLFLMRFLLQQKKIGVIHFHWMKATINLHVIGLNFEL